jgi:hypothetical protein
MIEIKEKINIKELAHPEPEPKSRLLFDPKRDIAEKHMNNMMAILRSYHVTKKWGVYANTAASLSMLFPERREEFMLGNIFQEPILSTLLKTGENRVNPADIKLLYPGTRTRTLENIMNVSPENLLNEIKAKSKNQTVYDFLANDIFNFLVLYPQKINEIKKNKQIYDKLHEWGNFLVINNDPYAQDAFIMKYVFPRKPSPFKLNSDNLIILRDQVLTEILKPVSYTEYDEIRVRDIAFLKVLTADSVNFNKNGLEIKNLEDVHLGKNSIDLPTTRRF